jgi:radical SAM superfamily enzyme YgiQ (UPF0313 family)
MKIGLIDVDGHNFPNLALMRISSFHKNNGDSVEWLNNFFTYDIVYKSKIFDFTYEDQTIINSNKIINGGTGYDLRSFLPEQIENSNPDYSIYPMYNFSIQLFTRGCIRNCSFCVVPKKEGKIRAISPMNLNPKGKYIEVLDNNFFANPNWKDAIKYLIDKKQPVNFHGIDARILTEEHAYNLNKLKHHKSIKIAWDNAKQNMIPRFKEIIKYIKPYKLMCYVLIGYNSTKEDDLYRVEKLRELGINPFVMPFNKDDLYQKKFARWVNHKAIFKTVQWKDYK